MEGVLGEGVASCGERVAMIGKCLDSNGREVIDLKFVKSFFLERGVMKSSRRE